MYRICSKLYENNELLDENMETFGIRTLSVDPKHGFCVNGKTVKLRGSCIHHDSGILGAATFYDAEYRRVRMLKEAGFNAIRMAHHPAASALLRACDELGMYVMDEAFDMWQRCKSDHDYGLFFDECWEKDVEAMVRKDFNHPCVVMYSIGNEIPEIGTDHGAKMCHDISEKIKESDPTRYTLASINGIFAASDVIQGIVAELLNEQEAAGEISGDVNNFMAVMDANTDKIVVHNEITKRLDKACAYTDIAGYNYMTARYELDGRIRPNRVIVGSETYPPAIAKNWELVESLDHVIGDFTWTGWDYLREAGIGVPAYQFGEGGFSAVYPCMLAYCGDIDITGHRRPASYYREIVFGLRQTPYIAVQNPYQYGKPS
ncbi:MAG: glycoside hydrolase family 2 TIM barrel-domain containing protein [Lachnospiraceae bacterium]|nr:glycoside hydrolase family 2 TIM barrel-domain containing protein [bacterium]MDY5516603.1 glycoside hydrolase family 2 TIM barrel-domain containing protein [Lachnospiraceae bacterium]